MLSEEQTAVLRQQVANAIADQLTRANIDWASFDQLSEPSVHIEAEFQEKSAASSAERRPLSRLSISQVIDLTGLILSQPASKQNAIGQRRNRRSSEPSSGTIVPLSRSCTPVASYSASKQASDDQRKQDTIREDGETYDREGTENSSRMAISGLRPSCRGMPVVEDNTQRQMEVMNENFPKRRKADVVGYAMKPSTLDKLITGIWEQLHNGLSIDPVAVLGELMTPPLIGDAISPSPDIPRSSFSVSETSTNSWPGRHFNDTTVFCRKVTQASRTCRSVEVIVQARWVEHFDTYVEHLRVSDPKISSTKHRKAALVEASSAFGWSEKELRNKIAIWRGYKEIRDAGGWAALIFAGMGIYRFCKYRVGFDTESMQRLHNLRPALEVAADTMNPNWRRLLSIVGESPVTKYSGHPHDWVICLDGAPPIPLRKTYLQWDPHFEYKHIEESVIDPSIWGSNDPRWKPPSSQALTRISSLFICQDCTNEQSDDPKRNCCYCFPSLFGCATLTPSPVQVFHTPDGRNNGLMALCAFERGTAVGEFVGLITKGLRDVDVMESMGSTNYQIWQGRQGNFTRFVNHSCNANAQYQRFTWLDTQRIILVSKGIEAGTEITVDYSDKYWRGLDKKCLCGKRNCRYSTSR
ncbi:hypothetical protein F5B22DRAFT_633684 [Xylaria bambusicola]|uniref:uncharacterized protein n=1 Tax=Xylaria bambusicola TaxID=326684 RepID=UPI002007E9EE|nr:uncharacterized protein F5B22DRAFT_633684 [Xylaria bambusicola]KAI0525610.1 hypothetical protein F5B22DRAFT_633684 [Xylaria bambusicola]